MEVVAGQYLGKSGKGLLGDALMELDASVGVILDSLDQNKATEDTILHWVAHFCVRIQVRMLKTLAARNLTEVHSVSRGWICSTMLRLRFVTIVFPSLLQRPAGGSV